MKATAITLWILVGTLVLTFGMCAQPGRELEAFRWAGYVVNPGPRRALREGAACWVSGNFTHEQDEWVVDLRCGKMRLAYVLRGQTRLPRVGPVGCWLHQETVPGSGYRYDLSCHSLEGGELEINTEAGMAAIPVGGDAESPVTRLAFHRTKAEPGRGSFEPRPFFSLPGNRDELLQTVVRWGGPFVWIFGTLGVWTLLYLRWLGEKRRRERAAAVELARAQPEVAQVAVRVPAWPPAGELEVVAREPSGHLALPSARWPRGAKVRLIGGAERVRREESRAALWWVAGLRRGGEGAGATHRTMEARLEPLADGTYVLAPRQLRWRDLDGWMAPVMRDMPVFISSLWGWRMAWLAVAVGPILGKTTIGYVSVGVLGGLAALLLSLRKR